MRDGVTQTEVAIITNAVVVAATQVPGPLYPPRLPRPAHWDVEDDLILEDDLKLCSAVPDLCVPFPETEKVHGQCCWCVADLCM